MEAVCVPTFVSRSSGRQFVTQIHEFYAMCRHLAVSHENRRHSATDIMKNLCRKKRICDLPALNDLYDLLASTVFEYNARAVEVDKALPCHSTCECAHCLPPGLELLHNENPPTNSTVVQFTTDDENRITDGLLGAWQTYLKSLEEKIEDHAYIVQSLKHAQKKYLKLKEKEGLLSLLIRSKLAALRFATDSGDGNHVMQCPKDVKKTDRYVKALEAELKILNDRISESYMVLMHAATDETKAREVMITKSHSLELHMRAHIKGVIQMAIAVLSTVFDSVDFSSTQRDKLSEHQDAVAHTAKLIFRGLSDKYTFVDYEVFDCTTPIPNTYIVKSPTKFKSASRSRQNDESFASLLDDASRPENVYVRVITETKHTPVANMPISINTRLKQKLCSTDVGMAFGWKRDRIGGKKTWGFYSTEIVHVI